MAAKNRTPIVPTRVPRAGNAPEAESSVELPILIRMPQITLEPAAPPLGERLSKLIHEAASSSARPTQVVKQSVMQAGSTSFQFLLRHPRLVAGTTIVAAGVLAVVLLVHQGSAGTAPSIDDIAGTTSHTKSAAAESAEAPPWNGTESAAAAPDGSSLAAGLEAGGAPPQVMLSDVAVPPPPQPAASGWPAEHAGPMERVARAPSYATSGPPAPSGYTSGQAPAGGGTVPVARLVQPKFSGSRWNQ